MKTLFFVAIVFISVLVVTPNAQATSYGFMREALREYRENPTEENKEKVEIARRKVKIIGIGTYGVPIALVGLYVLIRLKMRKKKESNKRMKTDQ